MKKELLFLAALCLASVQVQGQTTVDSGPCGSEADGSNLTWTLTSDGTLTISGTGDMADFTFGNQPWQYHLTAIRTAVVQEGVTSVGDYFLYKCTDLTSLTLPAGLMSVGDYFLSNCTGLTSIDLSDGLMSVGDYFLYKCTGLTSIDLPDGLTSVGGSFLYGCKGLTSIDLPAGLTSAERDFLSGCTGLTSLTLPAGLTSAEHNFLKGCTGLTSITLPEGLSSVGDVFLYGCRGLTSIDLPDGLTSVGGSFLRECSGLTSLTLPAGLTSAGHSFLMECTGLEELTVPAATPPVLGSEGAFADVDNTIPVYVPAGSTEAYAMADGWNYFTDYRAVGSTGIGTPSLAACVTVAGGEVRLHLADNPGAHVYDLRGRLVLSTTACRFALPPGIYIIKVGDDKVKVAL